MDDLIASLELVALRPDGVRKPIHVQVGRPHPDGKGTWACPIFTEGLDDKPRNIYGEDSMQALCLALRMVRFHLAEVLRCGSRLVYPNEDSDFALDAYFKSAEDAG